MGESSPTPKKRIRMTEEEQNKIIDNNIFLSLLLGRVKAPPLENAPTDMKYDTEQLRNAVLGDLYIKSRVFGWRQEPKKEPEMEFVVSGGQLDREWVSVYELVRPYRKLTEAETNMAKVAEKVDFRTNLRSVKEFVEQTSHCDADSIFSLIDEIRKDENLTSSDVADDGSNLFILAQAVLRTTFCSGQRFIFHRELFEIACTSGISAVVENYYRN